MINSLNTMFLYFLLAILPGLIWLLFFLKRDNLPEPKLKVLQIFYLGMFAVIPVAVVEYFGLKWFNQYLPFIPLVPYFLVKNIVIIGALEETFKYLIIKFFVLKDSCLDEPVDLPLYMIIAALGFATAENILLFSGYPFQMITEPFELAIVRFLGATLLHALASGIIGIFLALAFYWLRQKWFFIFSGLALSFTIHGMFDFFLESSIIQLAINNYSIIYPILLLIVFYIFLTVAIRKIRKLKGVFLIK